MSLKTLSAKSAAALDQDLMTVGAFSIDQLMELAGLSVSQAVYRLHPPSRGRRILVACGPGNNGGDGLVAARHLWHYGYKPTIYYPKQSKNDLYQRLSTQLKSLNIPFVDDFHSAIEETDHVVDAIFGFSFTGEVRDPFGPVIEALAKSKVDVTSVDAPSSWNIESGPPSSGPGKDFNPTSLVSLTAPKPLTKWFKGRHFLGGRFVSPDIAKKYDLSVPEYPGIDQVVELDSSHRKL
ncbi:hypothetical protein O988_04919 [Pseudogymnoascus sp. VKM F-3808]|nr:hypothetical protein V490_07821 [Pseudogymnoascus sp. VKM F-3557]KFX97358.1 hypothetical protein O988_04919 [Pseudogymnoascus sp. VKM F-3808]KFY42977.1 hypothetical protein V495_04232 [Pseudogymnoascus sp. VKM F-4514 (FW-929)]KFY61996.1 hypothetical protein V497_02660 [Pseudogymnoascus sp. VKM F-4516 (FW-969)]